MGGPSGRWVRWVGTDPWERRSWRRSWECPECGAPEGVGEAARGQESGYGAGLPRTPRVPRACPLRLQIASLQQEGEELSGQARCPFDTTQSNVAVFAGGHLGP